MELLVSESSNRLYVEQCRLIQMLCGGTPFVGVTHDEEVTDDVVVTDVTHVMDIAGVTDVAGVIDIMDIAGHSLVTLLQSKVLVQ